MSKDQERWGEAIPESEYPHLPEMPAPPENQPRSHEGPAELLDHALELQDIYADGGVFEGDRVSPFERGFISNLWAAMRCIARERGWSQQDIPEEPALGNMLDVRRAVDAVVKWCHGTRSNHTRPTLAGGVVTIGDRCIRLTESETIVLETLIEGGALTTSELESASGYHEPVTVLKRMRKKYNGALAPHITLPAKKGAGGYSTTIRLADAV